MNDLKQLPLLFQEFFNYIGLSNFKTELISDNFSSDYFIRNFNLIKLDYIKLDSNESICKYVTGKIEEMIDSVENSEFVKDYKDRINELNNEKEELNKEIERLKQFETHYNLQYNLTHGKKDE